METATRDAASEVTVFQDGLDALRESVRRSVADVSPVDEAADDETDAGVAA